MIFCVRNSWTEYKESMSIKDVGIANIIIRTFSFL